MSRVLIHVVGLTRSERQTVQQFVRRGRANARVLTRARMLLLADEGKTDREIIEVLGVCRATVSSLRKKYSEKGDAPILDILQDAPRPGRPIKVDSQVEAQIAMLACSEPPEGVAKWTLRLIADRLVELAYIDSISHETVGQALKKTG